MYLLVGQIVKGQRLLHINLLTMKIVTVVVRHLAMIVAIIIVVSYVEILVLIFV